MAKQQTVSICLLLMLCLFSVAAGFSVFVSPVRQPKKLFSQLRAKESDDSSDDHWDLEALEVLQGDEEDEDEDEWIPDRDRIRKKPKDLIPAQDVLGNSPDKPMNEKPPEVSAFTEEEQELIDIMGGKKIAPTTRRQYGYLGDSTLQEIASDYSVPICYLADVLCTWGVPIPINVHDRLGDLVTGEQAFALVEAVNSLDMGYLNDRYSNYSLMQLCIEFDMELKEVFEFAMKEGWSLPFGVRTNLRVEQEEEVLRVLSPLYAE